MVRMKAPQGITQGNCNGIPFKVTNGYVEVPEPCVRSLRDMGFKDTYMELTTATDEEVKQAMAAQKPAEVQKPAETVQGAAADIAKSAAAEAANAAKPSQKAK